MGVEAYPAKHIRTADRINEIRGAKSSGQSYTFVIRTLFELINAHGTTFTLNTFLNRERLASRRPQRLNLLRGLALVEILVTSESAPPTHDEPLLAVSASALALGQDYNDFYRWMLEREGFEISEEDAVDHIMAYLDAKDEEDAAAKLQIHPLTVIYRGLTSIALIEGVADAVTSFEHYFFERHNNL
jgi:hypothetical protein